MIPQEIRDELYDEDGNLDDDLLRDFVVGLLAEASDAATTQMNIDLERLGINYVWEAPKLSEYDTEIEILVEDIKEVLENGN